MTSKEFSCLSEFNIDDYKDSFGDLKLRDVQDIKSRPGELFVYLKDYFAHKGKTSVYQILNIQSTTMFLFLAETQTFCRTVDGEFKPLFKDNFTHHNAIVPGSIVSSFKMYQTTKTHVHFKSIEEEFPMHEEVLVCHSDKTMCGARGKVVGYANNGKQVKVRIEEPPRYSDQRLSEIIHILSTKTDIFFSLRFAAEILGTKFDQLGTILGSIGVVMPRDSKLPPSIDIGLNFMSRKDFKVVPNLVRVNFHYDKERKKEHPFKYLELSYRAL